MVLKTLATREHRTFYQRGWDPTRLISSLGARSSGVLELFLVLPLPQSLPRADQTQKKYVDPLTQDALRGTPRHRKTHPTRFRFCSEDFYSSLTCLVRMQWFFCVLVCFLFLVTGVFCFSLTFSVSRLGIFCFSPVFSVCRQVFSASRFPSS